MSGLVLRPITRTEGRAFVVQHHRHSQPPVGWLFGVGLEKDGRLVGVAMASRPVAAALQDGRTVEVTRVATDGTPNACSRLYGAVLRAAAALGYTRAVTYTLATEPGSSPAAVGFRRAASRVRSDTWHSPGRPKPAATLWGERVLPDQPRVRWERAL